MPPKLIIFDCDGVLVDSEMIASRQLAAFLSELGRPTTPAECRATFTGMSIKSVGELVCRDWDMTLPNDFVEQLRLRDIDAFARELKPIQGVADILSELSSSQTAFCVASSGTPEKIRHSLTITGLLDFFNGNLFSASQVTHGKPAPDLFEFAAYEMGVPPEQSIVIEDAAPGVQGGVAAGMTVFGFTGGSHCTDETQEQLRSSGAAEVCTSMDEILSRIINIS